MKFDTYGEYNLMWEAIHSGILYWKKVKQDAEGKICLQVNGEHTHYDVEYANNQIINAAEALKVLEDSIHPEWNGTDYEMVNGCDTYSCIVYDTLFKGG